MIFNTINALMDWLFPGDETAFQYKGDTCEYIFENAVGKEGRKNARC